MKKMISSLFGATMFIAVSLQVHAQGMVYDQQSATGPNSPAANDFLHLQEDSPLTQSFIPALSAIGFVQFEFWDIANNGTNGATVYVNLWTGSPNVNSATLLGSTAPVYMPNGFVNDGLGFAGITNFLFSTPIALNSGQTYYLQPVVQSGDDPWDIALVGDNYSNGQLYGGAGGFTAPFQPSTDLWFREGIVAVPEPSVLALVSLGCFLVYSFKWRSKLIILLLLVTSVLSIQAAQDSVVQATADEAGLSHVSSASVPDNGTFWVMTISPDGSLIESPYPFLPPSLSTLPIYSVAGKFIVDDTGGQITPSSTRMSSAQAMSAAQSQATSMTDLIDLMETDNDSSNESFQPNFVPPSYGSNDLWLSITSATNGISQIVIHPPWNDDISTDSWNLFYTTNLALPFTNWSWIFITDLGQTNLSIANATDARGFYALGQADTNEDSPVADGDDLPPICPNTTNNIITLVARDPNSLPLTYIVLTHPTNGVLSGTAPYLTYTPNPCFEGGQDSFTYKANDGTNDSAPATVTITVNPESVYANQVSAQACRGTPVRFYLNGGDGCGEATNYAVSAPLFGTVSNVSGREYAYTPTGTNFTGTDIFNYVVFTDCGDAATNNITITVGDFYLYSDAQSVMTGTNRPVAITLISEDHDNCSADTNYYTYTVTSGPTNGTLSGSGADLVYTPNHDYEGPDSFQFNVNDGVWTSSTPASVTLYVVAGSTLFPECDPFGTAVLLDWSLDNNIRQMQSQDGLNISDFVVYRSTNSGGPYTAIATNDYTGDTSWMTYFDTNAVAGQTNYYVVNFEFPNSISGTNYESPLSNEIEAAGHNPGDLIPADAVWDVVTNLSDPANVVSMRAPFSHQYPNQYPGLYPLPNTNWPSDTTWSNHITLTIPTNAVDLQYSIAIDNQYWLYVNGAYVGTGNNNDVDAVWSSFQSFPTNLLHYGTNSVSVVIQDTDGIDYFSMVVTTNTCGW